MKTKIFLGILFISLITVRVYPQVSQEWLSRYSGPGNIDKASLISIDSSGSIYVAGESRSTPPSTTVDYVIVKYNPGGIQQWEARYDGPAHKRDQATSMAVDTLGNVFITGYSEGIGTEYDYATIKYNSSGVQQWIQRYVGIKYDDQANSLAVDNSGNVYVTGYSYDSLTKWDVVTIKYNSNGDSVWVQKFKTNFNEAGTSIAVDDSGNVFVTGFSGGFTLYQDYLTIKYNSSGVLKWVKTYNGSGAADFSDFIKVDDAGNVYITGHSDGNGSDADFATIKYNSNGVQQWVKRYNGPRSWNDLPSSLAIDDLGNVYVTGASIGLGSDYNYATVKYNAAGVQQWVQRYDGEEATSVDWPSAVAVDAEQNVYVTGYSIRNGYAEIPTIKYNSAGVQQWIKLFSEILILEHNAAYAMAVDDLKNVYITGSGHGDMITIKYSQQPLKVNLHILTEGLYDTTLNVMSRKDTVTLYLREAAAPYIVRDSVKEAIDSVNFSNTFTFRNAEPGLYYLVVKHFNSIETWSKPGGVNLQRDGTIFNYDFTTSNSQAYGNNLRLKGSKYCVYSGDVDQDGAVKLVDIIRVYDLARQFVIGSYIPEDLTGDSYVNLEDIKLCYNNSTNFVKVIKP